MPPTGGMVTKTFPESQAKGSEGVCIVFLSIYPFVIDPDGFVQVHVVPNHHLQFSNHGNLPYLAWMQPTGVNGGHDVIRVLVVGNYCILTFGRQVRQTRGGDGHRKSPQPIVKDAQIVGPKIPKGVGI